jgi:hypothetical protein
VTQSADDKKQIGLAANGGRALDRLLAEGLFATEGDAYKFGIAYAIAVGLGPEDAPDRGYGTKFNATGGLDRDGLIRDVLTVLQIGDVSRPYATAERLAEAGLVAVAKRVDAHESLAEILAELDRGPNDISATQADTSEATQADTSDS